MGSATLTSLLGAFLATISAIYILRPAAAKLGLLDFPGGRKTHLRATPLVGGVGIFAGILLTTLLVPEIIAAYAPLLSLTALIVFIGVVDDAKDLKPSLRMTGHGLVALAMAVVADIQLNSFGGILIIEDLSLGIFSMPVTVFATVGVINAINMSDGIDGLSGGLVIICLSSIALLVSLQGELLAVGFIAILLCSLAAFLSMNFRRPWNRKALVYLGDAGSTMLGFIIAWLLIDSSQGENAAFPPVYALWFLAIPLFDTVNLLIKRPLRGRSPFKPGNDHLHHNLLSKGYSVQKVVATILAMAAGFATIGITAAYLGASETLMFQLFIGAFFLYYQFSDRIAPRQDLY